MRKWRVRCTTRRRSRNDRVTLLGVKTNAGGALATPYIDDSAAEYPGERVGSLSFPIAQRVARERKLLTSTESSSNGPVGEAAKPLFDRGQVVGVAVFSGTLSDVERSVTEIRRRILIAGAIALALSLVARLSGGAGAQPAGRAPGGGGVAGRGG